MMYNVLVMGTDLKDIYKKALLNRRFEEMLLNLFSQGKLFGTTHTGLGQEHVAVAVSEFLNRDDVIISNHRCHGHYLSFTNDILGLLAEIMGKEQGLCAGRGGSQHICSLSPMFFSNGIQGGMVPFGVGLAFAKKIKKEPGIVVNFIGDGTFGEGIIYEAFNLASLWQAPWLVIVENNRYAQSTKTQSVQKGTFAQKASAFDLPVFEIETNDAVELIDFLKEPIKIVRNSHPACVIIHTYRLGPHSKGDDFRNKDEINAWKQKDPINILKARLSNQESQEIETEVSKILEKALKEVETLQPARIN